jgi:dihydroorotase
MVNRDINLAEYTGSRLLLVKVTTERSVRLIREAKRKGLKVYAAVSAYHILLSEELLDGYDSNLKVTPPLRAKADINALLRGIEDGTIDIICSDHSPQDIDSKRKEFEYSEGGMITLESAFAMLNTALKGKVKLERIVDALAVKPRQLFGLRMPSIRKNEEADLTLFDPKMRWTFAQEHIRSKSRNTPVLGREFTGKPLGIVNNNKFVRCN